MIHLTLQNFTPKEIVQNVFSPLVAVVCSPQADEICQKNNLSFVEMLQPFTRLSTDAYFHDTTGATNSIKGIRINVCDVAWRPPQATLAKKILNEAVQSAQGEKTRPMRIDDNTFLDIPIIEHWFEQWRETFLTVQFPADHEFTRHFLSCLIVLSSSDPNPLESAQQLTKQVQMLQNITPQKLPKWFSHTDVLNCYVMLHDGCHGDITKAQQSYESLKLTFGENRCFLLQINSYQGVTPNECTDPWLKYLKRNQKSTDMQQSQQFDQQSTSGSVGGGSAPRTPQDISLSVTSMPSPYSVQMETPPSGISSGDEIIVDHPLSPAQEHATEAIHSNLSTSCDSLTSQVVNPNVWATTSIEPSDYDLPHGMWLTANDVDNLKHFIQDFTIRSLIPYAEKLVVMLSDAITNKKGVSRSLLSATKRWFVTNKPGVNATQNAVIYTNDSTELQTRKLGDLYFMFGNYNMAFQAYHQAKRDFNADSAWQFYAGALEMAALSAFMNDTANRKTYDYMEEAIVTYLNICKLPHFATRATILSTECLRMSKLYGEAAKQLIRMTNEDSDLRSAILLEQAAYCYLNSQPLSLYRKYAFHIVLAGHRYSKSGQRRHAFRCYKQAYQVFQNRGWSLAEDHIQYTIGKQAVTLKKLDEASAALAHLLRPSSLQSCQQQAQFLRDYIATQKTLLQQIGNSELLLNISLPKICHTMTRVLVTAHPPITVPNWIAATNIQINSNLEDEWKWQKLEEIVVQIASKKPIMIFKPTKALFTSEMPTIDSPLCIHGEPIEISFALENTIKPSITFEDINLLWTFQLENGASYSNSVLFKSEPTDEERSIIENLVTSTHIKILPLNEYDKKTITIRLIPLQIGRLTIEGVVGRISATNEPNNLWGKLIIESIPIKQDGPLAIDKPIQFDRKLEICVLPPAPALHVQFSPIPREVIAGEILPIQVNLTNSGSESLADIYVAVETPRWILGDLNGQELPLSVLKEFKDLTNETLSRDKESRKQHAFCLLKSTYPDGVSLRAQETRSTTIYMQAPLRKGLCDIKLLIYYSMPNEYPKIKYRLVRHIWQLNVHESVSVGVNCNIGNMQTNELGIDVTIKNLNQTHHPLLTEIFPYELSLYCPAYKLINKSSSIVFMQSPAMERILNDNGGGLRSTELLAFRVSLIETAAAAESTVSPSSLSSSTPTNNTNNPIDFLNNRLSSLVIKQQSTGNESTTPPSPLPPLNQLGSFLMKEETKFIGVLGQTGNSEQFNQIVSTNDPHQTIVVSWRGTVSDNSSLGPRITYGQHFIQLRHLYETIHCPAKDKFLQATRFASTEQLLGIYDFKKFIDSQQWFNESDDWDDNNEPSVARRCFLEVDDRQQQQQQQQQQSVTHQFDEDIVAAGQPIAVQ